MAKTLLDEFAFSKVGGDFLAETITRNLEIDEHVKEIIVEGEVGFTIATLGSAAFKSDFRSCHHIGELELRAKRRKGFQTLRHFAQVKDWDEMFYLFTQAQTPQTKATLSAAALTNKYVIRIPAGMLKSLNENPGRSFINRAKVSKLKLKLVAAAEAFIFGTNPTAYTYDSHSVKIYADDTPANTLGKGQPYPVFIEDFEAPDWTTAGTGQLLRMKDWGKKVVGLVIISEDDDILSSTRLTDLELRAGKRVLFGDTNFLKMVDDNKDELLPSGTARTGVIFLRVDQDKNLQKAIDLLRASSFTLKYSRAATGGTLSQFRAYLIGVPRSTVPDVA